MKKKKPLTRSQNMARIKSLFIFPFIFVTGLKFVNFSSTIKFLSLPIPPHTNVLAISFLSLISYPNPFPFNLCLCLCFLKHSR